MSDAAGKYAPRPGHIPGVALNLGGHEFVLAPLGLRLVREIEAKGHALRESPDATPEQMHDFSVGIVHVSLLRNYPDITLAEVADLVDTVTLQEAQALVLNQSGLKRVTPGEIAARG